MVVFMGVHYGQAAVGSAIAHKVTTLFGRVPTCKSAYASLTVINCLGAMPSCHDCKVLASVVYTAEARYNNYPEAMQHYKLIYVPSEQNIILFGSHLRRAYKAACHAVTVQMYNRLTSCVKDAT